MARISGWLAKLLEVFCQKKEYTKKGCDASLRVQTNSNNVTGALRKEFLLRVLVQCRISVAIKWPDKGQIADRGSFGTVLVR
jgi:hypothetical protein